MGADLVGVGWFLSTVLVFVMAFVCCLWPPAFLRLVGVLVWVVFLRTMMVVVTVGLVVSLVSAVVSFFLGVAFGFWVVTGGVLLLFLCCALFVVGLLASCLRGFLVVVIRFLPLGVQGCCVVLVCLFSLLGFVVLFALLSFCAAWSLCLVFRPVLLVRLFVVLVLFLFFVCVWGVFVLFFLFVLA
ncbi:hypothetical protein [Ahrensia kielensis]|uniref:hypothetical protein n=1 Tax=Ahrensia kielensis TaxID=76980 RepID=UPI00035E3C1C|nr:hypothetical protein [Ahrensia kielensis]